MKEFKRRFNEDPEFALAVVAVAVPAAALTITAIAKLIGSSGYALHAVKR